MFSDTLETPVPKNETGFTGVNPTELYLGLATFAILGSVTYNLYRANFDNSHIRNDIERLHAQLLSEHSSSSES